METKEEEKSTTGNNQNKYDEIEMSDSPQLHRVIGYILLLPALISVVAFLLKVANIDIFKTFKYDSWTGDFASLPSGGGYTSALPFYFGLMAIAGAYLIKPQE